MKPPVPGCPQPCEFRKPACQSNCQVYKDFLAANAAYKEAFYGGDKAKNEHMMGAYIHDRVTVRIRKERHHKSK